ncbi:hypothetical protein [Bradyrhizobium sp. JR3.5]
MPVSLSLPLREDAFPRRNGHSSLRQPPPRFRCAAPP